MMKSYSISNIEQNLEFEKFNCFFVDFLRYSFGRIKVILTVVEREYTPDIRRQICLANQWLVSSRHKTSSRHLRIVLELFCLDKTFSRYLQDIFIKMSSNRHFQDILILFGHGEREFPHVLIMFPWTWLVLNFFKIAIWQNRRY